MTTLSFQECSLDVLQEKFAKGDEKTLSGEETTTAIRRRVAKALAQIEPESIRDDTEQVYFEAQQDGLIMAGRVNSAAGTGIAATLINCFVQPVGDSTTTFEDDGTPGIYQALSEATETLRRGGGEGYNFSRLRPLGAAVSSTQSMSSGPLSFMKVFDASCSTVESAGARRGAQMAVMDVSHPDIMRFIRAKQDKGSLSNFNISVGVPDEFITCLVKGEPWQLVHKSRPVDREVEQRDDGMYVWETVDPQVLWDEIMLCTYTGAEPGVLFTGKINRENNLWYCETINATNPCGEQPLPPYGCCCLGSINLAALVKQPFADIPPLQNLNVDRLKELVRAGVRMLDAVLDVTVWPLDKQREEAMSKRRIGLGVTGVGDMLVMLGMKYASLKALALCDTLATIIRDTAYNASCDLAIEKGSFPLYDERYTEGAFFKRLPESLQQKIAEHGLRNSHLLSIAPTGSISLAFGDNVSNGIEPAFSWTYTRHKRMPSGEKRAYEVKDHAYRVWVDQLGNSPDELPDSFVTALELTPIEHLKMVQVWAPYIDAAISKTINCPESIDFESFKDIYLQAYQAPSVKGVTTYRPNDIVGAVLEVKPETKAEKPMDLDQAHPDRKLKLNRPLVKPLTTLKWPKRPALKEGNRATTYAVNHPTNKFFVTIGELDNGKADQPFEVWVNGQEQPRCLSALAKTLSTDLRSTDRSFLKLKLESLAKTAGQPFAMDFPGEESPVTVASDVAALARLITHRCEAVGAFDDVQPGPLLESMMFKKEPKTTGNGTMSWTFDVCNPSTGDDFSLFLKELELDDGTHRPFSLWLSGDYPAQLDGLCKSLSLDLRVDIAWAAKKLRDLADFQEPQGDFLARVPGADHMQTVPSTVAYIARLLLHRLAKLGLVDDDGHVLTVNPLFEQETVKSADANTGTYVPGKRCDACWVNAVIRQGGCNLCTACGTIGNCG